MEMYGKDWIGRQIGEFTITGYEKAKFICKCSCGQERIVKPTLLAKGRWKSCGHSRFENTVRKPINGRYKDDDMEKSLYVRWKMDRYRERKHGMENCAEWRDFAAFKKWAYDHGYGKKSRRYDFEIKRIDSSKPFSPDNAKVTKVRKTAVKALESNPF